jgi:hypothetical protein
MFFLSPDFQWETPSLHLGSGPRSADLMNMNQKFFVATSAACKSYTTSCHESHDNPADVQKNLL